MVRSFWGDIGVDADFYLRYSLLLVGVVPNHPQGKPCSNVIVSAVVGLNIFTMLYGISFSRDAQNIAVSNYLPMLK